MSGGLFEVEHSDWNDSVRFVRVVSADCEFGGGVGLEVVEGLGARWAEDPGLLGGFRDWCSGLCQYGGSRVRLGLWFTGLSAF